MQAMTSPSFLRALDERELKYVCAVASDFGVRLLDEMREAAATRTQTPARKWVQPKKPRPAACHDAQAITQAQPECAGQTVERREGSQGPLRKTVRGAASPCRDPLCAPGVKRTGAVGPAEMPG